MKRKAFSITEVLVSIFLFFISLAPILKYTDINFSFNRRYLKLERVYRNFLAIEKQILNKDIDILLNNLGKRIYTVENFKGDSLTENIYLPYDLEKDFKLEVDISKTTFKFESERYEYISLKIMYIGSNKNIISEKYVDIYRGKYEK